MDLEERVNALAEEFPPVKEELKRMLLDIRAHLMEVYAPLRAELGMGRTPSQIRSEKRMEEDGEESQGA